MSDRVGHSEDRFSHNEAQIVSEHTKGDDTTEANINNKLVGVKQARDKTVFYCLKFLASLIV